MTPPSGGKMQTLGGMRLGLPLFIVVGCIVLVGSICLGCMIVVPLWLASSIGSPTLFLAMSGSPNDNITNIESWCFTPECQERLMALRSKLELEEQFFQDQLTHHRAIAAAATECQDDDKTTCMASTTDGIISPYQKSTNFRKLDILRASISRIFEGGTQPSISKYRPKPEWRVDQNGKGGSFPTLNVVGQIKTGTSQLYNLFATHQDVTAIAGDSKEHCSDSHYGDDHPDQDLYEYALFQWHDYYYRHKHQGGRHHVNGCLSMGDLEMRYAYNPPAANTKFFFLLRDPADWAWAAYNFFCDVSSEVFEADDNWVNATIHYRSPEAFHELVLSGGKLKGSDLLTDLRENSIWNLRRLRALVGHDNLIVLKNENLQPDRIHQKMDQIVDEDGTTATTSTLDYLASRAGLDKDGFDETVLASRSNCGANKGYDEKCVDEDRSQGVGYPVTNGRPMLESTRKFLYVQWYETCKIWAEEFGVVYPNCLSALDDGA